MATLRLNFYDRDDRTLLVTEVVGRLMKTPKDSDYRERYYCHRNPYGIQWVCRMKGRRGYDDWDILAYDINAEKRVPMHHRFRYSKV